MAWARQLPHVLLTLRGSTVIRVPDAAPSLQETERVGALAPQTNDSKINLPYGQFI